MRHKSLQILSVGLISAMLLVGCGSSNTGTTDTSGTANSGVSVTAAPEENTDTKLYGEITSIDGSTITVALGTKKSMDKGNGQGQGGGDGTAPSGQPKMPSGSDDANAPSGTGQPEMPSGSDDANANKGQRPSMLELTGETKSITVEDSTTITVKSGQDSSTGELSSLKVGDTIAFELASNDTTAATITVQSMGQKGNGQKGNKQEDTNSTPAATDAASN